MVSDAGIRRTCPPGSLRTPRGGTCGPPSCAANSCAQGPGEESSAGWRGPEQGCLGDFSFLTLHTRACGLQLDREQGSPSKTESIPDTLSDLFNRHTQVAACSVLQSGELVARHRKTHCRGLPRTATTGPARGADPKYLGVYRPAHAQHECNS